MDIELCELAVHYGPVKALRGVSLTLPPGTVSVLVGPNGAGKSTLMGALLGLVRPDGGRVLANGQEVAGPRRACTREFRARLGYLPEAAAFSENLSGRQVLRFFAWARGVGRGRIEETLERVGLSHAAGRRVGGYSRGMRQRLGLGVAILHAPDLLVLDEPTGGLDQQGLSVLWEVLREWQAAGRTVLLSTHEVALIERRADQMHVLLDGRLRASGAPAALRRDVRLPIRIRLELDREEAARALAGGLAFGGALVEGRSIDLSVTSEELLRVLREVEGHPVTHLRVEEPGLDEVYEHILGGGTWDASPVH